MSITDFIVDLLQKGTPVEIPGIGTLKNAYGSTTLTQSFNNDKSIVQYIAEKECVSYSIAEMMWKNYVDALTDKLAETHSHELPMTGFINYDGNGYTFGQSPAPLPTEEVDPILSNATIYKKDENDDPFAVFEQPIVETPTQPEPTPEPEPAPVPEPKPEPKPVAVPEPEPVLEPEPVVASAPEPVPEPAPAPEPQPVPVPEPKPVAAPAPKQEESVVPATPVEENVAVTEEIKKLDKIDEPKPEPKKKDSKKEKKSTKKNEEKKKKKRKGLWIFLLILLLLLGGAFCLYRFVGFDRIMDFFTPKEQPVVVEPVDTFQEVTLPIEIDTVESEPEVIVPVMAAPAPAPKPKAEPAVNVTTTTKSQGAYDLIAGFYTSKASAAQMQKLLKADGCAAYIIEKNNGYYVSMGHASSYTEAQAKLEHVKSWYEGDVVIKNIESATSMI